MRFGIFSVAVMFAAVALVVPPARGQDGSFPACPSSYALSVQAPKSVARGGNLLSLSWSNDASEGDPDWVLEDFPTFTVTNSDGSLAKSVSSETGWLWKISPKGRINVRFDFDVYAPAFHGGDVAATRDAYQRSAVDCRTSILVTIPRSKGITAPSVRWVRSTFGPAVIAAVYRARDMGKPCELYAPTPVDISVTTVSSRGTDVQRLRWASLCDYKYLTAAEETRFNVKPNLQIEGVSSISAVARSGRTTAESRWTTRVWTETETFKRAVYADTQAYWAECIYGYTIWIDEDDDVFCYLDVTTTRLRWSLTRA